MTRRAIISTADLKRMADVAKSKGVMVWVEIDGRRVVVSPDTQYLHKPATDDLKPENFTSLAEWQAWRERERAREARGKAPAPKRDSAWDIPWEDIPPEPIQPPLNWRERKAMDYLMAHGPEIRVDWYALKDYGSHTQKKLEERGFVEASAEIDRHGHPDQIWLTKTEPRRCVTSAHTGISTHACRYQSTREGRGHTGREIRSAGRANSRRGGPSLRNFTSQSAADGARARGVPYFWQSNVSTASQR